MIDVLVVTHGPIAEALVETARTILGSLPNVEAVAVGWSEDPAQLNSRLLAARQRLSGGDGLLILTDMFGGTPTNLALTLLETGRVEVVTGVNLPMLLRLVGLRDAPLADVANKVREAGVSSMRVASGVLARTEGA